MLPNTFYIQSTRSRYKIHQKSYEKVSSKKDYFNVFLKYYKSGQNTLAMAPTDLKAPNGLNFRFHFEENRSNQT